MCTAMTMRTPEGDTYFGRTMDFSYPLDPELYFAPKGYQWNTILNTHKIHNQYHFMGIGQDISPIVFADGVNEEGFAAAALYFPGFARYDPIPSRKSPVPSVATIELVGFLLALCASVEQAAFLLRTIRIVGVEDSVTGMVAPLHWILADRSGSCMTVEKTEDGLHLMNNSIGVLSNSPDFKWHMTNLRTYGNLTAQQFQEREWGPVKLSPFGQGAGSFGLPGDFTPPSRFIRTAFQKSHAFLPSDPKEAVTACFHILESVSIPKGIVMTNRQTPDFTQYTAFIRTDSPEYFFKTYDNSGITAVKLPDGTNPDSGIISLGKLNRPVEFDRLTS